MGCEESRDGEYWDSIPVGVLCGKPGTERADVLIVGRFPTILCDDCYAYWKEQQNGSGQNAERKNDS